MTLDHPIWPNLFFLLWKEMTSFWSLLLVTLKEKNLRIQVKFLLNLFSVNFNISDLHKIYLEGVDKFFERFSTAQRKGPAWDVTRWIEKRAAWKIRKATVVVRKGIQRWNWVQYFFQNLKLASSDDNYLLCFNFHCKSLCYWWFCLTFPGMSLASFEHLPFENDWWISEDCFIARICCYSIVFRVILSLEDCSGISTSKKISLIGDNASLEIGNMCWIEVFLENTGFHPLRNFLYFLFFDLVLDLSVTLKLIF